MKRWAALIVSACGALVPACGTPREAERSVPSAHENEAPASPSSVPLSGVVCTDCWMLSVGCPSIDASVEEVDREHRRVTLDRIILDKGARDDVKLGYGFDVYRDAVYKGFVRVIEVDLTTCTADLLFEKVPIEPGDSASTAL